MLNSPLISTDLQGRCARDSRNHEESASWGCRPSNQSLFDLFERQRSATRTRSGTPDSVNDLRLNIKLHSKKLRNRDNHGGVEHLNIV